MIGDLCFFLCQFTSLRLMDLATTQAQMKTIETNIFHLLVRGLLLVSVKSAKQDSDHFLHTVLTQYTVSNMHAGAQQICKAYCTLTNYRRLVCCTHLCTLTNSITQKHTDTHAEADLSQLHFMSCTTLM